MASEGPLSPGTLVDDSAVGTVAWSDPTNAASSNDAWAVVSTTTDNVLTHYLKVTNFGFAIPTGSTIDGITVSIERKASAAGSTDFVVDEVVSLVKEGTVQGDNKKDAVTKWPLTEASKTYGSSSDLWGLTFTAAQINGSDFGLVLEARMRRDSGTRTGSVDHITITVNYTLALSQISGSTSISLSPAGRLTGAGVLRGSSTVSLSPAGRLTGAGALAGSSTITISPSGRLLGAGALRGTSTITLSPTAFGKVLVPISGASTISLSPAAFLRGLVAISGASTISFNVSGLLGAISPISGVSTITISPSGRLTGAGALRGNSSISLSPTATLTASAALAGLATITLSPSAFGQVSVPISGVSTITISPTGRLTGAGALAGNTTIAFAPTATITGAAKLAGTATITLNASAAGQTQLVVFGPYTVDALEAYQLGTTQIEVFSLGMVASESTDQ